MLNKFNRYTWSEESQMTTELSIQNFLKIFENERLLSMYSEEELNKIIIAIKKHTLLQSEQIIKDAEEFQLENSSYKRKY